MSVYFVFALVFLLGLVPVCANNSNMEFWGFKQSWGYRNRLGLLKQISDTPWVPFISNEVQSELAGVGLNQNRAVLGVLYPFEPRLPLNAVYLHHPVLSEGCWIPEQGLFVNRLCAATDVGFSLGSLGHDELSRL